MKISAKTDYACRALLELALHWPDKAPMQLSTVAKNQKIPMKFLTQIMLLLKQFGYVESTRGKSGGYLLAKAPGKIKLGELVINIDNIGLNDDLVLTDEAHVMDVVWHEIDKTILESMQRIDFEAIANRQKSRENVVMFHI